MPTECVSCKGTVLAKKEVKWGHTLYECASCKLQFWWPFKNPGHQAYESSDRYRDRDFHPKGKNLYKAQELFLESKLSPGSTLLDLGMGTGRFISAAEKAGYDVTGTDFDQGAALAAKKEFRLDDVYNYDIGTFFKTFPDRRFGIITIFEVLEHLDGFAFFDSLKKALEPNGYLALSVPYRDCWKQLLVSEGPPNHLTRWNEVAMAMFLESHGFKIVTMKKMPVRFKLVITQFNDWTKGYLSFSTVRRIEGLVKKKEEVGRPEKKKTVFMRILNALSYIKMYAFFGIPAAVVYTALMVRGRHNLNLYVVATHANRP
jgi:SAM-dependent methyltransferase